MRRSSMLILAVAVIALSIAIVRRRLKYEWWYAVHLCAYGVVGMAFGHQFEVGTDFAEQNLPRLESQLRALYAIQTAPH